MTCMASQRAAKLSNFLLGDIDARRDAIDKIPGLNTANTVEGILGPKKSRSIGRAEIGRTIAIIGC